MVEIYGKNQAVLSSVLYTFNDNRENTDWNGFNALSTVNSRTSGSNIETQIPLFDLGATESSEIKVVWQTTNNEQMDDLADKIVSSTGNVFSMSEIIDKDQKLTKKDFTSDQDVRWCPGCGDYAILAQVQKVFPELGIPKKDFLVVSGIGCSSRFPYYMNTYGFHSIHGRAPAIASGAKLANPNLSVWIATGDGDAMSIGGNHLIHILRRNMDIKILMFNNRIYGLTKGQYSPTSELGKKTKSTPMGSLDHPFNPLSLALGSGATFVARTLDRESKHLAEMVRKCNTHRGTSFVDICG